MIAPSQSSAWALLGVLLGLLSPPLLAQTCTVPGSHLRIQAAIYDPTCTTITLAAQTYAESLEVFRSVSLAGPAAGGAVIQGQIRAVGSTTQVTLQDLQVENGCTPNALLPVDGAWITGVNLRVEQSVAQPCPPSPLIFRDGFESGDISAWSGVVLRRE